MNKKYKKTCKFLNFFEHVFIPAYSNYWLRFNFCICFVILWKDKLNTIEVLISKALTDSYIRHD